MALSYPPVRAAIGRLARAGRQQRVALGDRARDVDDAAALRARMVAQQVERCAVVEAVTLHQDALGALDDRAPVERRLELLDLDLEPRLLLVAAQGHLDGTL